MPYESSRPYKEYNRFIKRSAVAIAPLATTISITTPTDRQPFQRNTSNQANITITGTVNGSATIEARLRGGAWTAIATATQSGNYTGTLNNQTTGQGTLEVRLAHATGTTASRTLITVTDVWLVAGQSNNEGRFTTNYQYTNATFTGLRFRQEDTAWSNYSDPSDKDVTNGSVWGQLGELISADQNIPFAVVCAADGGTGLVSPANWSKGGTQYNRFIATVQAANLNGAKGVIWMQGETDGRNAVSRSAHGTALSQFVDDIQIDLGMPGLKLICGLVGANNFGTPVPDADMDNIRLAQQDRINTDPDILFGAAAYDFDVSGDGVHYVNAMRTPYAQRIWRALKFHFYGGTEGRGATYSTAFYNQYRVEVTFSGGVGTTFVNGTSSNGWRVSDANGTRIISSITTTNKTVTINVDQPLTAPVNVTFASGNTTAGLINTIIKDQGAIVGVPPEPFVNQVATFSGAINPGAAPDAIGTTLFNDAVSIWRLEEASTDATWVDAKAANNLTNNGSVASATESGNLGKGATFSGSNYLLNGSSSNLNFGTNVTIVAVIRPTNNSTDRFIIGKYDTNSQRGWAIRRGSNGNSNSLQAVVSNNGTTITTTTFGATTAVANNATALVVMQYTASSFIRISVNAGTFLSTSIAFAGFNSTSPLSIGGIFGLGIFTSASAFIGSVYWAGFWNRILTTEEINYLYNGGSIRQL